MRNRPMLRIYLSVLGALALLAVVFSAIWLFGANARKAPAPQYLLKDHAGHLALYTADGGGPLAEYPTIYTRLLPEQDLLALQQGLPVADETELARRLEDYGL
ncbi:MAG: hypothetical protein PHO10_06700 [Gemmiger sp.]|nr:hypothetical protein [Gemmiger sp.]